MKRIAILNPNNFVEAICLFPDDHRCGSNQVDVTNDNQITLGNFYYKSTSANNNIEFFVNLSPKIEPQGEVQEPPQIDNSILQIAEEKMILINDLSSEILRKLEPYLTIGNLNIYFSFKLNKIINLFNNLENNLFKSGPSLFLVNSNFPLIEEIFEIFDSESKILDYDFCFEKLQIIKSNIIIIPDPIIPSIELKHIDDLDQQMRIDILSKQ